MEVSDWFAPLEADVHRHQEYCKTERLQYNSLVEHEYMLACMEVGAIDPPLCEMNHALQDVLCGSTARRDPQMADPEDPVGDSRGFIRPPLC